MAPEQITQQHSSWQMTIWTQVCGFCSAHQSPDNKELLKKEIDQGRPAAMEKSSVLKDEYGN